MSEKQEHIFLCGNGNCLTQTSVKMTPEEYERRFYFSRGFRCPICGIGNAWEVKE